MLNDLREKIDELKEDPNKEIESIKKNRSEMKNIVEEIDSRLDEAEDWMSDLEHKVLENAQLEHQKEILKKWE